MDAANVALKELTDSINRFCAEEHSVANGAARQYETAAQAKESIRANLPHIVAAAPSAPDVNFVRYVINYAVKGLTDRSSSVIWDYYFKGGTTMEDISNRLDVSMSTVRRNIDGFPQKVAVQLWDKELEISTPHIESSETLEHRAEKTLEKAFALTPKQAEVLLAFCRWQDLGRRKILELLFIEDNTIKVHIKHINKAMGTGSVNEAVKKAEPELCRALGDDWREVLK